MKKLMIAAVLASFAGVASAACADPTPCETCLFGYKIQLVAKTTIAGSVSNVYAKACGCYRKPTMGKIVGYLFGKTGAGVGQCGDATCACNDWFVGTDGFATQGNILLWKAWNKKALPVKGLQIDRMNRIGYKDRSTVESKMVLTLADIGPVGTDAQLVLAGFGKAAHRADGTVAIKSANGYFAGQMLSYCQESIEQVCGDPIQGQAEPSHYWAICEDATVPEIIDDPLTAAYGKWQMVWDPQLVARLTKQGVNSNTARPSAAYEPQNFEWDHE